MKVTKFLNIDIEPAPPEMELQIEMQCREIMQANDLDNVKRYCTHLLRKKFDQDIFMASLLNRLIELDCLLYTSPSPRDRYISRMPSSA